MLKSKMKSVANRNHRNHRNSVNRMQEITKQEQLILRRKKEIEERLKGGDLEANNDKVDAVVVKKNSERLTKNSFTINCVENVKEESSVNRFKNDGSFMERFKKLQQQMDNNETSGETTVNSKSCVPGDHDSSDCGSELSIKKEESPQSPLQQDCETVVNIEKYEESIKEEQSIRFAIEKTAIAVAVNGPEAETVMKDRMGEDDDYRWLNDPHSYNYKYFLRRVGELKSAKRRAEDEQDTDESKQTEEIESNERKRPRKSRWSEAPSCIPQDIGLIQYAIQVYGKTDITTEQWKQLEDQRKMRILCDLLQEKQRHSEMLRNAGKVRYEYDSDEETDGGTWEHKRRQTEMAETQEWAETLTENSKGRHHLGDFLPAEELEKFMFQWEAVKDKKTSLLYESDYESFKLQSDNIGYRMLKKLGWKEGDCLGTKSEGIVAPINRNESGAGNAGLGALKPHELREGDDEYDAYRKRMMLAYRFRPNPLNNPRRAYY